MIAQPAASKFKMHLLTSESKIFFSSKEINGIINNNHILMTLQ